MVTIEVDAVSFYDLLRPLMLVCGIWTPQRRSFLYRVYCGFSMAIFSVLNSFTQVMSVFFLSHISELGHSLWMSLDCALASVKGFIIVFRNENLLKIAHDLESFRLIDYKEQEKSSQTVRFVRMAFLFYVAISMSAINLNFFFVLYTSEEPTLNFPAWIPILDWQHNQRDFIIVTIATQISNNVLTLIAVTADCYSAYLMSLLGLKMDIIADRIGRIGQQKEMSDAENSRNLLELVKLHQNLNETKKNLVEIFSPIWTLQFAVTCISLPTVVADLAMVGSNQCLAFGPNEFPFYREKAT